MKKVIAFSFALMASATMLAQGAHDFKISEVFVVGGQACCGAGDSCKMAAPGDTALAQEEMQPMKPGMPAPDAPKGYQDEYGESPSWIEIMNTSYSTHELRNCFLTTNRDVLNKDLTAPQRIAMMSLIPKGDPRTSLSAKQRITFFADGHTNRGTLHTNFRLEPNKENFIALYDGNGVTLLDSVTVPPLPAGSSYARVTGEDGKLAWEVRTPEEVTPNAPNEQSSGMDKVAEWKEKDPYGIAMTIIAMAIVFFCLALLYVFFRIFGWLINRSAKLQRVKAIRKIHDSAEKLVVIAKDGMETKGIEMENYAAAIGLALHEYTGNMHDVESGVITIEHHPTEWENKEHLLRHAPEVHHN